MTMIGDEEGANAVMDAIQELMDNMTDEDWDRVIEDLRNRVGTETTSMKSMNTVKKFTEKHSNNHNIT